MGQWILKDPTCPVCRHGIEMHIVIKEMGMTVCRGVDCKCVMTFNYSQKTLEEMR